MRRWLGPLATIVLGTNLWVALLLVPTIHTDAATRLGAWVAVLVLALPLLALAVGCALLALAHRRSLAALLVVFPVSLLVPIVVDPALVGPGSHGGLTFALTLASLLAYGAGVAWLLARRDTPSLAVRTTVLRHPEGDPLTSERRRDRRIFLALSACVPFAILVFPLARPGGLEEIRGAFPSSSGSAAAAIVAVASALAAGVLLVYFGPPLRRARAVTGPPSAAGRARLGWTFAAILLGAIAALVLALR